MASTARRRERAIEVARRLAPNLVYGSFSPGHRPGPPRKTAAIAEQLERLSANDGWMIESATLLIGLSPSPAVEQARCWSSVRTGRARRCWERFGRGVAAGFMPGCGCAAGRRRLGPRLRESRPRQRLRRRNRPSRAWFRRRRHRVRRRHRALQSGVPRALRLGGAMLYDSLIRWETEGGATGRPGWQRRSAGKCRTAWPQRRTQVVSFRAGSGRGGSRSGSARRGRACRACRGCSGGGARRS